MPDTTSKRQRREVKARKRQAKDDRRAARHAQVAEMRNTDEAAEELRAELDDQPVDAIQEQPQTDGSEPDDLAGP